MTKHLLWLLSLIAVAGLFSQTQQPPLVDGNAKSGVRVLVFEDLQCTDCAAFRRMMDEVLLPKYGGRVAFEHRDFPLPKHKWAMSAAKVAHGLALNRPELALAFRRYTMNRIADITVEKFPEHLDEFAKLNKVNPETLRLMMNDEVLEKTVNADIQDGVARGVSKTPTVFVNGQPFVETFSVEEISKGIDAALAEAGR